MTFPTTSRRPRVELFIAGNWVDITKTDRVNGKHGVHDRDNIEITRGRSPDATSPEPSKCTFTINNHNGWASPRNQLGPYYQKIGRNTRVRVPIEDFAAPTFDATSSPTAGTGDLSWTHTPAGTPRGVLVFVCQNGSTGDLVTAVTYGGVPMLRVHTSTTLSTLGRGYFYHLGQNIPTGAQTILVARTGAGITRQATAITVTAPHDTRVHAVTTTGPATGANPTLTMDPTAVDTFIAGMLHSGQDAVTSLAAGAGHSEVREEDFGTQTMSVIRRTAAAAAGIHTVSWTATSDEYHVIGVAVSTIDVRFAGEVTSFPNRWDDTGNDAFVLIEASGILRRIGQGDQPVTGGLKGNLITSGPVTYYPLDDGEGSTVGAPAAGTYMASTFRPQASFIDFGVGDLASHLAPTMRINDTQSLGFLIGECIGSDAAPDALAWDLVYKVQPTAGTTDTLMPDWNAGLRVDGTAVGTQDHWSMHLRRDGVNDDIELTLYLDVLFTSVVVALGNTGPLAALTDGGLHHVRLSLTQDGADVDWAVLVDGTSVLSGTRTTHTLRRSVHIAVDYDRTNPENYLGLGHLIVWENTIPAAAFVSGLAHGFVGETAGRRIERLCAEEAVPFDWVGDLDATMPMGLQFEDYFSNQLAECEAADMGVLYEPRGQLALAYRTRSSLYNQTPGVTADPSQLMPPFEPTDDDRNTRNDIFAERREGSSFRATQETGPLSVQDPPNGVGRYKDEAQLNVQTDAMLPAAAGWLRHLGTTDEARYPQITVNLADNDVVPIADTVLALDIGDRFVGTDLAAYDIHDDVSQLIVGYAESLNVQWHRITYNCEPESPYQVLEADHSESKISSGEATTLNEDLDTTETSIDVISTAGTRWTTDAGQMPISIMVGGEEMTVAGISGAGQTQTFSPVTRSVNGVVKTHPTGTVVRVKRPATVAL